MDYPIYTVKQHRDARGTEHPDITELTGGMEHVRGMGHTGGTENLDGMGHPGGMELLVSITRPAPRKEPEFKFLL